MLTHLRSVTSGASSRALKRVPARMLQRKCACGTRTPAGGECEACGKKKLNLQRRVVGDRSVRSEVPPIVHEVLSSPGQPLDSGTRALMEPRFGHEFSQVRVHTAHGRFTGYVLLALPAALAVVLSFVSPEHIALLFRERMGQMMLVGAMVLQTIGFIWIRQVIKIEV